MCSCPPGVSRFLECSTRNAVGAFSGKCKTGTCLQGIPRKDSVPLATQCANQRTSVLSPAFGFAASNVSPSVGSKPRLRFKFRFRPYVQFRKTSQLQPWSVRLFPWNRIPKTNPAAVRPGVTVFGSRIVIAQFKAGGTQSAAVYVRPILATLVADCWRPIRLVVRHNVPLGDFSDRPLQHHFMFGYQSESDIFSGSGSGDPGRQEIGPRAHKAPSSLQQVRSCVGLFDPTSDRMVQSQFHDRVWRVRLFCCPIPKTASKSVDGRAICEAAVSQRFCECHV